METQTAVLEVMTGLIQQLNTPEKRNGISITRKI